MRNLKALVVGDFFLPSEILIKSLNYLKDEILEVKKIDLISKDRYEARNMVKVIETKGPEGVKPPTDMVELIKDVDILVIHLCPVPVYIINKAKKLKLIATARGGLENIDLKTAKKRNITIINTPAHNAEAVAEYTIGLMVAETRNIARSHHYLINKVWQEHYPNSDDIPEINSSIIGLLGFGVIARAVARKLKGFDCRIMVHDPYVDKSLIEETGCIPVDLKTLLSESDILSIHARLSKGAKHIIGLDELKLMKPTSYLINTSRANIIDMDSLYFSLKNKIIKGAALDVFDEEPISPDNLFLKLDNVTLTNHRAGDTKNCFYNSPVMIAKNIRSFVKDGILNN
jgi:D-3-phosphoglycerate dehydrogenase / 2-oxoglutarate reductase